MTKVYCGNCQFYCNRVSLLLIETEKSKISFDQPESCDHPDNKVDNYLGEKEGRINTPSGKNWNNECDWYKVEAEVKNG